MGFFPLFIDLAGKPVLIVGGGKVAERKVQILREFDASIRLVSPEATQGLLKLADSGAIRLFPREYRTEDIGSATLAVAATGDKAVNRKIHDDAVRKGVPVNVVDDPELCTFFFPAVVHRNDFVVGITTSGSYPALAKYARQQIEMLFPEQYGQITEVLKESRKKIQKEIQSPTERAEILERLMTNMAAQATQTAERRKTAGLPEETSEERAGKGEIPARKGL